jgi:hypothetical protein
VEASESGFEILIDGQPIVVSVKSTGGYDQFETVTLGQTDQMKPGEHKLQIKPNKSKWKPINLRSVTLDRVD